MAHLKTFASDNRDPRFQSNHGQFTAKRLLNVFIMKTKLESKHDY